jgi:hypothetical protein
MERLQYPHADFGAACEFRADAGLILAADGNFYRPDRASSL